MGTKTKPSKQSKLTEAAITKLARAYPQTEEAFPWGDHVVKVKKKVFVFMGTREDGGFGMSVKLPRSAQAVLAFPFAQPTGYGLGKSGWVSVSFGPNEVPPMGLLKDWLDESFRAVAPAKLLAAPATATKKAKKKAAAKKPTKKETTKKKR